MARRSRALLWFPLAGITLVISAFIVGLLRRDDTTVSSHMIGQQLPAFSLPSVRSGQSPLDSADFADGKTRLINVFASWCGPCAGEMPELATLKRAGVTIEGIAIRDRPADSLRFLQQYGDPFDRVSSDGRSSLQIAMGSSGVPETFIVDGAGIIRGQYIGPVGPKDLPTILATVQGLRSR